MREFYRVREKVQVDLLDSCSVKPEHSLLQISCDVDRDRYVLVFKLLLEHQIDILYQLDDVAAVNLRLLPV